MSDTENIQIKFNNIDFSNVSTGWVHKLNKEKLIRELARRNLITTGLVTDLKNRLLTYLKGESPSDDFEQPTTNFTFISDPIGESEEIETKINMGDNKKPFFKPGKFTGNFSENVETFLKKYNRAAIINGWSDIEKSLYIPIFLEDAALIFYDNVIDTCDDIKWPELEDKFRSEFEPIAQIDMLRAMLDKRKQLSDEPTITYINEIESLCRRIDRNMSQEGIVRSIIKGLKPMTARMVGMLENNSLDELKKNVRKYELIEFITTGEIQKTPFEIQNDIIQNKIHQINSGNKNKNDENEKLRDEVNQLKKTVEELKISRRNENTSNNIRKFPREYPHKNIDTPYWHQTPFPFNKPTQQLRSVDNNKNFNNNTKQCKICSRSNHTENDCYFKNKPSVTCQICNKFGHSAINCRSFTNNQKN